MQSWMERLGLMLAMLAMLIVASVPAMANHDDECDDEHWDGDEWVCVDDDDDEEFDGIEIASFDLDVVCFIDADWDGLHDEDWHDGHDNDLDGWIDEDDIDCFVEED